MCTIHLAAMVHIIYILTENKTSILLSFFSFTTASLVARCDSKSLPDHSRVLIPLCMYEISRRDWPLHENQVNQKEKKRRRKYSGTCNI